MAAVKSLFLGTGDAFSADGRHQSGYLVFSAETNILLDCGATTLTSLKRQGVSAGAIDTILISHLHGDHFAGIPFLLLEYTYAEPRTKPLMIAGPPGTEERVRMLFQATYRDLSARPLPFTMEFREMLPGKQRHFGSVKVEPFLVPHQEHDISLGLSVYLDGRKIVYSGDTGWTESLLAHSQDSDLFICECCFFETRLSYHLDYPRLAENRERFGSKRTILTHLGREVFARRREIEMELATDGLQISI
jgi:ribonuclease BN (tRNA processing enzyme)